MNSTNLIWYEFACLVTTAHIRRNSLHEETTG